MSRRPEPTLQHVSKSWRPAASMAQCDPVALMSGEEISKRLNDHKIMVYESHDLLTLSRLVPSPWPDRLTDRPLPKKLREWLHVGRTEDGITGLRRAYRAAMVLGWVTEAA